MWKTTAALALMGLSGVHAACSREALLLTTEQYKQGLTMGLAGPLENIADDFEYRENNKTAEIWMGVMFNIHKLDSARTIVDLEQCATYTEIISATSFKPYVIGTQIRHHPEDNSVYLIDTVASTVGHWFFNATQTLAYAKQEDWSVIEPPSRRPSREFLKAAADAYLDMWGNKSAIDAVPWGTPCTRLEGSVYTGRGFPDDSCKVGIPSNNTQLEPNARRYVIDETVGSVNVLCVFRHLRNAADSHEFRVVDGKLRYVHTITIANSTELFPGLGVQLPSPSPSPSVSPTPLPTQEVAP